MNNLTTKAGQAVSVVIDTKNQTATVNGRVIAGVRNNKVKVWNCDILTDAGNKAVKEAMTQQFCKKVETGKKGK